jgi:competence protein ComEC
MSKQLYLIVFLAVINIGIFWYIAAQFFVQDLAVHFLSVGQGDSHLVVTKHARILIDTGPGVRASQEIDRLMPMGDRVIDIVMISHPNVDHFYGLLEIIKRYQVRLVLLSGVMTDDAKFNQVLGEIKSRAIPVLYARQGQEITWDRTSLKILWPDFQFGLGELAPEAKLNDTSLVTLLSYQDFDALFTGDISAAIEKKLAAALPEVEVLKVSHHGSKYSTAEQFLRVLQPKIAVIPVGQNRYGHPSNEVLGRLMVYTQNIFDTLSRGTVTIISNGQEYSVLPER